MAIPTPETRLVASKLGPPPIPAAYVDRPRLHRQLDRGLDERVRLTVVAAPPGYGKTVAVAAWLRSAGIEVAWLSLDRADDDLARFTRYVAAALETARPGVDASCAGLFGPGSPPSPEVLGATLTQSIAVADEPFALVLDDFHVIRSPLVRELVRFLVERGPPFCHLVLVAREDPPLPLARLRANGRLVELRASDLRYLGDEVIEYFAGAGVSLPVDQSALLNDRMEGWPAGLQLAAVALASAEDREATVEAFLRNQRFVLDYLADEVLDRVDDELREFLERTCVAERFDASLCAELTGRDDASALLERAERAHLFLVPLDQERRWYRFHQLFADYLRSRLAPAERTGLHRRAARWLERAGLTEEAIPHYLASGEMSDAARLVELVARRTFEAGELSTLLGWLDALPAECLVTSDELASWHAWTLFSTGQLGAAVAASEALLAAQGRRGAPEGRVLILLALLRTVTGPEGDSLAAAGLELVGDDRHFRSMALQAIGLTRHASGDLAGAIAPLREAFELARDGGPNSALPALTPLGQALNAAGRRNEAEALCHEALASFAGPRHTLPPMAWYVDVVLGLLRYEANDVPDARRLLERGFDAASRLRVGRTMVEWGVSYLALARRASGSPEAALAALRTAVRDVRASGIVLPVPVSETEARIRLLEGDVEAAARWADTPRIEATAESPLQRLLELSNTVTVARVRLAQHRPDDAAPILRRAEAAYRASGAVAELISVLVLEAVADDARGRRATAISRLREAVALAAPGGYVRRFVEDGSAIVPLLPFVRKAAPVFVDEVLAANGPRATGERRASVVAGDGGLVELLTGRELDVLRLLATGARNADVAAALGVSVGTARWHVGNVLAKLGEPTRAKAVLRARELGWVQ